jgi:hypothetical protein
VGRTSVEAVGEAVEVIVEDLVVLGEVEVMEAWRRTRRSGRGPDDGR